MHSGGFEKQFEKFMKRVEYQHASEALFNVARSAFLAGWLAAEERAAAKRRPTTAKKRKGVKSTAE